MLSKEEGMLKMWKFLHPDVEPTIIEDHGYPTIIGWDKYNNVHDYSDAHNLCLSYTESELVIVYVGNRF